MKFVKWYPKGDYISEPTYAPPIATIHQTESTKVQDTVI